MLSSSHVLSRPLASPVALARQTVRFKSELARNITIKLGYANAKIYRSETAPFVFAAGGSRSPDEWALDDGRKMRLVRHVSFVDCPGHDILMATMLNGAAVMDAVLLLIAANEPCPQPQTLEHLAAIEIMQLNSVLILQNKIDIIKEEEAMAQYQQIRDFVDGTVAGASPIIPISAQLGYNTDVVAQFIARKIPVPVRDFVSTPRLIIIRSFDVNKPGQDATAVEGGVAGGSILQGVLRVGDEIEIRPGIVAKDASGNARHCIPIHSRITSLKAEQNDLQFAVPGGLIGVGTRVDPTLTRADRLVGQVMGHRGKLPDVYCEVAVNFFLLRRLLGVRAAGGKQQRVSKLTRDESVMVNIGSTSTAGRIKVVRDDVATIELTQPVCTVEGEKVALSRKVDKHWRLIGWGTIRSGVKLDIVDSMTATASPFAASGVSHPEAAAIEAPAGGAGGGGFGGGR